LFENLAANITMTGLAEIGLGGPEIHFPRMHGMTAVAGAAGALCLLISQRKDFVNRHDRQGTAQIWLRPRPSLAEGKYACFLAPLFLDMDRLRPMTGFASLGIVGLFRIALLA